MDPAVQFASTPAVPRRPPGVPPLRGTVFPPIVSKAFLLAARARIVFWDRALREVEAEQMKLLRGFLHHAQGTEFGRAHGFSGIRTYEQFARAVPVGDYDSFW